MSVDNRPISAGGGRPRKRPFIHTPDPCPQSRRGLRRAGGGGDQRLEFGVSLVSEDRNDGLETGPHGALSDLDCRDPEARLKPERDHARVAKIYSREFQKYSVHCFY